MNAGPDRTMERSAPGGLRRAVIVVTYALLFLVALPAGLWALGGWLDGALHLPPLASTRWAAVGSATVVASAVLIGWSVWLLARRGRGWPISHLPPRQLVRRGPYAFVRHPIYLGCTGLLVGAGMLRGSMGRAVGAAAVLTVGWTLYVRLLEEPVLRARFGPAYDAYRAGEPTPPADP